MTGNPLGGHCADSSPEAMPSDDEGLTAANLIGVQANNVHVYECQCLHMNTSQCMFWGA